MSVSVVKQAKIVFKKFWWKLRWQVSHVFACNKNKACR